MPDDLPAAWQDLLRAMTARAPEDRPSAHQVAGRLAALELGSTHDLIPLAPTRGRRQRAVLVAAAAAIATALILAGTGLFGPGEPTAADKAAPDRTPSAAAAKKSTPTTAPSEVVATSAAPEPRRTKPVGTKTKPKVTPKAPKSQGKGKTKHKGGKGKGRR